MSNIMVYFRAVQYMNVFLLPVMLPINIIQHESLASAM
jgi:hypothetical protein